MYSNRYNVNYYTGIETLQGSTLPVLGTLQHQGIRSLKHVYRFLWNQYLNNYHLIFYYGDYSVNQCQFPT